MADVSPLTPPVLPDWFKGTAFADDSSVVYREALVSPVRKEVWKYTPVRKIQALSTLSAERATMRGHEQDGVTVSDQPLADVTDIFSIQRAPEAFAFLCQHPLVYINVAASLEQPLHLIHTASSWPIVIDIAAGASLTLTEEFASARDQQQVIWLRLGRDAQVTHGRNSLSSTPNHWQFLSVQINTNGHYSLHNHAVASPLRRQDIQIQLCGDGANANLCGAAMAPQRGNLDQQVTMEHLSANTTSQQTFHNIVADRGKSTFNGRIHIHAGARNSNANLSNKNIGLGANATINTKPELEIYNDDVSCSHGATIGQLDNDQLFYLCSRGVDPNAARQLLCEGFLQQCVGGPLADRATAGLLEPLQGLSIQ